MKRKKHLLCLLLCVVLISSYNSSANSLGDYSFDDQIVKDKTELNTVKFTSTAQTLELIEIEDIGISKSEIEELPVKATETSSVENTCTNEIVPDLSTQETAIDNYYIENGIGLDFEVIDLQDGYVFDDGFGYDDIFTVDTSFSEIVDVTSDDFAFDAENWYYSYELQQMPKSRLSELLQIKLNVSKQSDLSILENTSNLEELSLAVFSDISLDLLALLPNLKKISIYGEHASWYSLDNIDVLTELPLIQYIYIGNVDVNLDLSLFNSLKHLEFLSVQAVRSVFFTSNDGFDLLKKLSIAETSCDLNNFPDFPQLKELLMNYCDIIDEKNIEKINCFTDLERLSLRGSVKEYAPYFINLKNLLELDICFEADYAVDKVLIHNKLNRLVIRDGMFSEEDLKTISDTLTECEINAYLTY